MAAGHARCLVFWRRSGVLRAGETHRMVNQSRFAECSQRSGDTHSVRWPDAIEVDPVEMVRYFVRKWRVVVGVPVIVAAAVAVVMLLTANRYTSHATILPSTSPSSLSSLVDLAGSVGFNVTAPAASGDLSALFPQMIESNRIRDAVLARPYQIEPAGDARLQTYFGTDDPDRLRQALARCTRVRPDKKLGVVDVAVETGQAALSQQILNAYLEELDRYLTQDYQSQASQRAGYLAEAAADRAVELAAAENRVRDFLAVNRNWAVSSDPDLNAELQRLQREVEIRSQTYRLLCEQLELARLDAQKAVPIVRILDEPTLPSEKSGPHRVLNTALAAGLSLMIVSLALVLVYIARQWAAHDRQQVIALRQDLARAASDGKRLLRFVRSRSVAKEQPEREEAPAP